MEIAGSLRASQGGHGAGFDRSTTGRGTPHPMSQAYQQQQQQKQQRQRQQQQQQQQQHEPFYQNTNSDELQYERKEAQMYQNVEEAQRTQHPRPDLAQVRTGHPTMRACANGTTPMRHMATKMLTGSSHVPRLPFLPPSPPHLSRVVCPCFVATFLPSCSFLVLNYSLSSNGALAASVRIPGRPLLLLLYHPAVAVRLNARARLCVRMV